MQLVLLLLLCLVCGCYCGGYRPYATRIRCERNPSLLQRYLERWQHDDSIFLVSGTCIITDSLTIKHNNVNITDYNNDGFIVRPLFPGFDVFNVLAAKRFSLTGAYIDGNLGLTGIRVTQNGDAKIYNTDVVNTTFGIFVGGSSNLALHDVNITSAGVFGFNMEGSSSAEVTGLLSVTGTRVFAVNVAGSSSFTLRENARAHLRNNNFGLQVSSSSTMQLENEALLDTSNNAQLGFSINTGASLIVFQSTIISSGNGLDGASVSLGGTAFVDNNAQIFFNNNNRTGLRIEQGIVRANNAFFPVGPLLEAKNNSRFGVEVSRRSYLDWVTIASNRGVNAADNDEGNVVLDLSSIGTFESSSLDDITIGFMSFAEFEQDNNVVEITCNEGGVARGELDCP